MPQQHLAVARLLRRVGLRAQLGPQAGGEVLRGERGIEQPLQLCSLQLCSLQLGRPPRVAVRLDVGLDVRPQQRQVGARPPEPPRERADARLEPAGRLARLARPGRPDRLGRPARFCRVEAGVE